VFCLEEGVGAEAEMAAMAQIGFDGVAAADQLAVRRHFHVGIAMSFGNRTRS
jgi:hypothetical protein